MAVVRTAEGGGGGGSGFGGREGEERKMDRFGVMASKCVGGRASGLCDSVAVVRTAEGGFSGFGKKKGG